MTSPFVRLAGAIRPGHGPPRGHEPYEYARRPGLKRPELSRYGDNETPPRPTVPRARIVTVLTFDGAGGKRPGLRGADWGAERGEGECPRRRAARPGEVGRVSDCETRPSVNAKGPSNTPTRRGASSSPAAYRP